jgi:hypothetical protein
MSEEFDRQLQAAKQWARQAREAGWLAEADIAPLAALENRSPASLFEAGAHRPLVAAFFGGTGVGKSTLLNRLAGQPIARAGVERPTSREVSIYLHESLHLRQLPPGFPVDRVRVARHADERRRGVLWIDMPDIDSTEAVNRDLVADWLPHVDVLIYVVSPERYRDDKGWRLLREHVREHAWLFVINQWDRGQPAQREDFLRLLGQGGFAEPLLFCTDCREDLARRKPDEFAALEASIQSLADSHLIEQLELCALEARRGELRAAVGQCLARLGGQAEAEGLRRVWAEVWGEAAGGLSQGLEWPMAEVARAFVQHDASPLRRAVRLDAPQPPAEARKPAPPSILWDEWAQMQWQDALDRLLAEADALGLPPAPLKAGLAEAAGQARKTMLDEAQRALRLSLARPGNAAQRFFLKLAGVCAVLLPLAAMGWVSWLELNAYYESASRHTAFLGLDFVANSALTVALAWLLPFFIKLQLKPSTERAALRGLRKGVEAGLARIGAQVDGVLAEYAEQRDVCAQQGGALLGEPAPRLEAPAQAALRRWIPGEESHRLP